MIATTSFAGPHLRGGKPRPLGLTSAERFSLLPAVPPVALTLPAVKLISWQGMGTPPGIPRSMVDRLNREVLAVLVLP
ncbi:MAG: tripartite tricarboxylate transporter substrate-binding protein [Burkholderiales bacterium]